MGRPCKLKRTWHAVFVDRSHPYPSIVQTCECYAEHRVIYEILKKILIHFRVSHLSSRPHFLWFKIRKDQTDPHVVWAFLDDITRRKAWKQLETKFPLLAWLVLFKYSLVMKEHRFKLIDSFFLLDWAGLYNLNKQIFTCEYAEFTRCLVSDLVSV